MDLTMFGIKKKNIVKMCRNDTRSPWQTGMHVQVV